MIKYYNQITNQFKILNGIQMNVKIKIYNIKREEENKCQKKIKDKRAITLITLVITIILLIILA